MWNKITVQQFQQVYAISNSEMDYTDKASNIISVLYNMTLSQVDDMQIGRFNELSRATADLVRTENIPGKAIRTIKAAGRKYFINYDTTAIKHGQYIDISGFGVKPIENMHLLMASVVQPINWYGKKIKRLHHEIAGDLLQARVMDVYHSCVFFCKVYLRSMEVLKDSLIYQMIKMGLSQTEAQKAWANSLKFLDGCIPQKK